MSVKHQVLLMISECVELANFRLHFPSLRQVVFTIKYNPMAQNGRFGNSENLLKVTMGSGTAGI